MAVTTYATEYSTQVAKHDLANTYFPSNPLRQPDDRGTPNYFWFEFTQGAAAGDVTSTQGLFYLPAGRWRPLQASINCSAFSTSVTLDIGFATYTQRDGTVVAADPNAFVAAKDVSAALVGFGFNVATWVTGGVIENIADTLIYSTVAGAVIPIAATLKGWITFGSSE